MLELDDAGALVREWFGLMERSTSPTPLLPFLADEQLVLVLPQTVVRSKAEFCRWYENEAATFAEPRHGIERLEVTPTAWGAEVQVSTRWRARRRSDESPIAMRTSQRWELVHDAGDRPRVRTQIVRLEPDRAGGAFAHVGFACKDPAATDAYYSRHFGFRRARVLGSGEDQVVFLRSPSGDLRLELFRAKGDAPSGRGQGAGPETPGFRHLAFLVADVDAAVAGMGRDAVVTLGPLQFDEVIPGWRTAWVADPDGRIVELTQGYVDAE